VLCVCVCGLPVCVCGAAGMHALLSRSRSLMHVNIDGCPRLTLASCPPCFIAVDALVGGRQLEDSSSIHRRPGVIIRVPT